MKPTRYHIIKSQEPTPPPRRAILFFSGWGFDAGRLDLEVPGYDTIFLWDYTEKDAGAADIDALTAPYSEIIVIGWSFGVKGAAEYINNTTAPVTRTIAVNGTENHIDDQRGIPSAVFEGTLAGLSPLTLRKFQRRATGAAPLPPELAASMATTADNDQICRLRNELDAFGHLPHDNTPRRWSVVVVSENDRIFPAENQLRAWQGQPDVRIVPDGNHFLPMADLRQYIVDKQLVSARFEKAAGTYGT
ncbi:MAG: alpha/beta fold hydrolase, partial [Muribaculaceae bacterium]|nr:alpha/beta fold hydrolase [Muribaculaceae bacterium]